MSRGGLPGSNLLTARGPILALRNGYAATALSGVDTAAVTVTTLNDSGVGSLRSFLEDPTAQWVRFDPALAGGTITLTSIVNAYGNKIIDGRGCRSLTINNQAGLVWTSRSHLIVAYVTLTSSGGSNNSVDGATSVGCDLVWLHHVSALDCPDSCFDFTGWGASGQCRVTADWCRIGPNPGYNQLVVRGRTSGPHGNLLGLPSLSDDPAKGLFTFHHCLWEGLRDRGPYAQSANVHVYSSANRKWGDVNGGGYAMEAANSSQMLVESCIFDPYDVGEPHIVSGVPVMNPDREALLRRAEPGALIKASGLWLKGGAQTGLSVSGTPFNGTSTHTINPVESFNDTVFTPPYSYSPDTADQTLYNALLARAGNVQAVAA